MYLKYYRKRNGDFSKKIELRHHGESYQISGNNNEEIILEGKFYYINLLDGKSTWLKENTKTQLSKIVRKYGIEYFINNVEGEYTGIWINKKNNLLKIFSDKLKQAEVHYFYNSDIFIASTECREIIKGIDKPVLVENSLVSSVLLYVPGGHTIFKNIYRLKYNEIISIHGNRISVEKYKDEDIGIEEYSGKDILRYEKTLLNSILSRASDNLNLVFSSGGWDSTMLLAILRKNLGKNKVRGVVMNIVFPDGRCFNEFEVYKAKALCKSLDIEIVQIPVDYRNKELYRIYEEISGELFYENIFYNWPTKWGKAVSFIREKYGRDVTVFNGEGCDSLHNYGFAQYISLMHEDNDFREYADKMKNYLYGPAFFKKVKNNTFLNDTIYKIFLYFNRDKEFVKAGNFSIKKRTFYYLLSFVYSDIRLPFRKISSEGYIRNNALQGFEDWLEKEYFADKVINIKEDNFYYYLSYLYTLFHLQSPQIRVFRKGLSNVRFPFIDLNLFKYLYKMPQDFGRGLNFNQIKFPLKELAKKVFSDSQLETIRKGAHSYLSEIRDMNINDEYLLKGADYKYMKDNIDINKVIKIFDSGIFVTERIKNLLKDFRFGRAKNLSDIQVRILLLSTLLSVNN